MDRGYCKNKLKSLKSIVGQFEATSIDKNVVVVVVNPRWGTHKGFEIVIYKYIGSNLKILLHL